MWIFHKAITVEQYNIIVWGSLVPYYLLQLKCNSKDTLGQGCPYQPQFSVYLGS